jgi:hypothetical protein
VRREAGEEDARPPRGRRREARLETRDLHAGTSGYKRVPKGGWRVASREAQRPDETSRPTRGGLVARDVLRPARGLAADAQVRAPAMRRGRRASGSRGSAAQRSGAAVAREARTVQLVTQAVPAVEETHAPRGDSAAGRWEGTPPPVLGLERTRRCRRREEPPCGALL